MFVFVSNFAFLHPGMTIQKIMRVKVRSSQDVNDLAVQVAILEQVSLILHKTPLIMYKPYNVVSFESPSGSDTNNAVL